MAASNHLAPTAWDHLVSTGLVLPPSDTVPAGTFTLEEWRQDLSKDKGLPCVIRKPPFCISKKLFKSPAVPQPDAHLLRLPLDIFVQIFEDLDQYDQIILALTCKTLLQLSARMKFKYNLSPKLNIPRELCALIPGLTHPCHDPQELAGFITRFPPRCARLDLSRSAWRPCCICLQYKSVLVEVWRVTGIKRASMLDPPVNANCKRYAIKKWCQERSKVCPSCALLGYRLRLQHATRVNGLLEPAVLFCDECDWCLNGQPAPMP